MATDTKLEMGLLEKIGEKFTNFGDNTVKLITRIFGSSNERFVRKLGFIPATSPEKPHTVIPGSLLAQVNELEPTMQALSDDELKELTPKFRERPQGRRDARRPAARGVRRLPRGGPPHQEHAALRRADHRRHRPAPAATSPRWSPAKARRSSPPCRPYLNALEGKGVHVVTVNDYLARRDCEWMLPIYHGAGHDRRRTSSRTWTRATAAGPTTATSPTAPTASSASTTCATT